VSTWAELDRLLQDACHFGADDSPEVRNGLLNDAYARVVLELGLNEKVVVKTLAAGDGDYSITTDLALPTLDHITELRLGSGAPYAFFTPAEVAALRATGSVRLGYALMGVDTLMLTPAPTQAVDLTIVYGEAPAVITAGTTTAPPLVPAHLNDAIALGAIARWMRSNSDNESERYEMRFRQALAEIRTWLTRRAGRPAARRMRPGYPVRGEAYPGA